MPRFAFVLAALGFSGSAFAADMALKAPPPPPAPVYNWTGFYAGLNAGGGWGSNTIDNSFSGPGAIPQITAPIPGQFDIHSTGFIGGAQAGYNYQSSAFVWGVETDFQGANIRGNASASGSSVVPPPAPAGSLVSAAGTGSEKLDWFGTLRGRLGWTVAPPVLLYATGGLAYGHVQTGESFSLQASTLGVPTASGSIAGSRSSTQAGWTIGAGLEWMLAPQWSVKGEYLYYDLGAVTLNQTLTLPTTAAPGATVGINIQSIAHNTGNIARIGVNHKF